MRAAVLRGPGAVGLEEMPEPSPATGELVVRVHASGLCGTDVHKIAHADVELPAVLGHEIVGTIAAVGRGVDDWQTGQRVAVTHHVPCFVCEFCRKGRHTLCPQFRATNLDPGGFAEFVRLSDLHVRHTTRLVPEAMTDETATFVEPLACCMLGMRRAEVQLGDRVLILGGGGVGLLFVQLAREALASSVLVSDLSPERLRLAGELGADVTIDANQQDLAVAVADATQGHGADVIIVTASVPSLVTQAGACAARGGRILVFGGFSRGQTAAFDVGRAMWDEVSVVGSYSSIPQDLTPAITLLDRGRVRVDELVSGRFGLHEVTSAVAASAQGGDSRFVKALIVPGLSEKR